MICNRINVLSVTWLFNGLWLANVKGTSNECFHGLLDTNGGKGNVWFSFVAQLVKNSLQCGRPGFGPWVWKIAWRREKLPTPVVWHGEFHGVYSPRGHKQSGMTERLSLSTHSRAMLKFSHL